MRLAGVDHIHAGTVVGKLERAELNDRHISYTMHSYAAEQPHGARYQGDGSGPEPD